MVLDFKDPVVNNGKQYALVAKRSDSNECCSVQNDGSLKQVTYEPSTNRVILGSPKLWNYVQEDNNTYLRHAEDGYYFEWTQKATNTL